MSIDRRRFLAGTIGITGGVLVGCSDDSSPEAGTGDTTTLPDGAAGPTTVPEGPPPALAPPGSPGLVDEAVWQTRVDEYLQLVTSEVVHDNQANVIGHLVRAHREADYEWDTSLVTLDSFERPFAQFDNWTDTRDFRFMDFHWILHLADGETPSRTLDPVVLAELETRLAANRWRYDDPLPDGVIDSQWFWSENHLIIGLCDEYLAGQRMPERVFDITGLTGAEHVARCKPDILEWVDERARFGFFEFHSNVYMVFNVKPLMMLAEMADDPELVRAAGMAVDLCLLDIAAHTHRGAYAAPRGRTYKSGKSSADSWSSTKFLFDDSEVPIGSGADNTTLYFCGAHRYRPPQTILDVAVSPGESLVRERHGVFVDGAAPVTEDPEAPFGYDFKDPANLEFWWSQGGIGLWQLAEVGLAEAERFRIFETEAMEQIQLLVLLNDNDPKKLADYVQRNHAILNFGHLQEVNTYHWRNDVTAMATAMDYRFGAMRDQVHEWLAVIDDQATVYTTHPLFEPRETTDWGDDGKPGYWTGTASMPRSVQHERTSIHIYQPAWDETTDALLWSVFPYLDFTHAFFPQDHFEEVVQDGNWTFGREGDGYIALYSWRTPTWREWDPAVYATRDMVQPFDLVAEGGPDNVWIAEVGDASQGSFADWVAARVAAPVEIGRDDAGFTVDWTSPASGALSFGSTGPFAVDGVEQQLADFPRHESPWGTVDRLEKLHELAAGSSTLALDFDAMTREHT